MPDRDDEQAPPDFFISYTQTDQPWAEWIAWQLEDAGYRVVIQAWDIGAGADFAHAMQKEAARGTRVIPVLSEAYFSSKFGQAEWLSAWADDPTGEERRVVPVRVEDVKPLGFLRTRVFINVVGVGVAEA